MEAHMEDYLHRILVLRLTDMLLYTSFINLCPPSSHTIVSKLITEESYRHCKKSLAQSTLSPTM